MGADPDANFKMATASSCHSGSSSESSEDSTYAYGDIWPTTEYDAYWIYQDAPFSFTETRNTLGKWLVFKHRSKIDETWERIRREVESGALGATGAKVSTMRPNPNSSNPDIKVICVYTTKEEMDEVGLKLIQLVGQTIKYKTDEATRANKYTCHGDGKVTCRTLEWNRGKPYFRD